MGSSSSRSDEDEVPNLDVYNPDDEQLKRENQRTSCSSIFGGGNGIKSSSDFLQGAKNPIVVVRRGSFRMTGESLEQHMSVVSTPRPPTNEELEPHNEHPLHSDNAHHPGAKSQSTSRAPTISSKSALTPMSARQAPTSARGLNPPPHQPVSSLSPRPAPMMDSSSMIGPSSARHSLTVPDPIDRQLLIPAATARSANHGIRRNPNSSSSHNARRSLSHTPGTRLPPPK